MWLLVWLREGKTIGQLALTVVVMGICFGLATASFYLYEKRKHKLPSWQELNALPCD
jgi:Family of unknown function (DUF6404)